MKGRLLAAGLLLCTGCFDFTQAKEKCLDPDVGDCIPADRPTLSQSSPENQQADVPVDTAFLLTFSAAMQESSIEVTLNPPVTLGTLSWDEESQIATVQPASALQYNTQYSVQIRGKGATGRPLASNTLFTFNTRGAPDVTPPTLQSTLPPANATNVPVNFQLVLNFSEPMGTDSLTLTQQPDYEWGEATWSNNNTTATFSAAPAPLVATSTHFLSVSALDAAGNALTGTQTLTFTSGTPPDTTKPTVLATAPAAMATGVSPNVAPSVTFSERMDPASTAAFSIVPSLPCVLSFDPSGTLLTCAHPSQPLLTASTKYTVTIAATAKDAAGNTLATPFSFEFTTGMMVDNVAPTLASTVPLHMGTGASRYQQFTATFSEAMDKAATQAAFAVTSPASVSGTFAWNAAGTALTFAPSAAFNYGAIVQWQIGSGAKDLAGNSLMGGTQQRQFRVSYQGSKTIYVQTDDGYMRYSSGTYNWYPTGTYFYAGDSNTYSYRSFLTFDLTSLPTGTSNISEATLHVYQFGVLGTPYDTAHGSAIVERVTYDKTTMDKLDWAATAMSGGTRCTLLGCEIVTSATLSTNNTVGWKIATVTGFADAALGDKKVQFRLRFSKADNDGDAVGDYAYFGTGEYNPPAQTVDRRSYLSLTYEYP